MSDLKTNLTEIQTTLNSFVRNNTRSINSRTDRNIRYIK